MMIVCGWCGHATEPSVCAGCGRDPVLAWYQRGLTPPEAKQHSAQLAAARRRLRNKGQSPTAEALAEEMGVSERTIRRWMSGE